MSVLEEAEHLEVIRREDWRAWLLANGQRKEGVWVVTWKKHTGERHVSWPDLVREALCFGWIDGRSRRVDDQRTKLWVTPRRRGSPWSAVNKALVQELEAAGEITPAGWAVIRAAQQDGSWNRLDAAEALVVPPELRAALGADRGGAAWARWEARPASLRKRLLTELVMLKGVSARERKVAQILASLSADLAPEEPADGPLPEGRPGAPGRGPR